MLSSGNERQQKLGIYILDYLNREIFLVFVSSANTGT